MIVSQFAIGNSPYHGVSVHYRLLLTNLAARPYYFRITLRSHHGQLDRKAAYSVERQNSYMLDLFEAASAHRYRGRFVFSVSSQETVRIQLRPFDVLMWQIMQESMDARGYVELTIPEIASGWGGMVQPQGSEPVPVLLHAFAVDWATQTGYRDPAPVTLSSGMAENEITPEGPMAFEVPKDLVSMVMEQSEGAQARGGQAAMEQREDIAAFIENPRSVATVVAYLGLAGELPENVKVLNDLLHEAGHTVRLLVNENARQPRRRKR